MATAIHLFPEHNYFETGGAKLNKKAVILITYKDRVLVVLILILGIILFVQAGNDLRRLQQFETNGVATRGIITHCRETYQPANARSGGSNSTNLSFNYFVDGKRYTATTTIGGSHCDVYYLYSSIPLYYLRNDPSQYSVGERLPGSDWLNLVGLGTIVMLVFFLALLVDRYFYYKHALLQAKGVILEAKVVTLGTWTKTTRFGEKTHHYAKYVFENPNHAPIQDRIQSDKRYPYPYYIQEGDKLDILYVDDKTYCVL